MSLSFTRLTSGAASTGPQGAGGQRPLRIKNQDDVVAVFGAITFDSSYVTGGITCAPSSIGLAEVFFFECDGAVTAAAGNAASAIWAKYNYDTGKLMAFGGGTLLIGDKEIANGTSLAWATVRFMAFGRK